MLNEDLKYQSDMMQIVARRGEKLFTEVIGKTISKYKMFCQNVVSNYAAYTTNNYAELMNVVKSNAIHKLADFIADKITWHTATEPYAFESYVKGTVYVLSEEEIKALIWDCYNEALNTMREEIHDKR